MKDGETRAQYIAGVRFLALGELDAAIKAFQDAKLDAKLRFNSLAMLGRAFMKKGWRQEAIDTFRNAIEIASPDNEPLLSDVRQRLLRAMRENDQ